MHDTIDNQDWSGITDALDSQGFATTEPLLTPAECAGLAALHDDSARFRRRIVMARHGFGRGEYQYFGYPLPPLVAALRTAAWPHLAGIADRWNAAFDLPERFPAAHTDYLAQCHAAGQSRPTPLLLRYGAGDFNCLHQDVHGDLVFPLQLAVLLNAPGEDFSGGEFVLTEQRPRAQSRAHVVPLRQGQAVIFAVRHRPARGTRGVYRAALRHGVSTVTAGRRHTLGVIFHDAA